MTAELYAHHRFGTGFGKAFLFVLRVVGELTDAEGNKGGQLAVQFIYHTVAIAEIDGGDATQTALGKEMLTIVVSQEGGATHPTIAQNAVEDEQMTVAGEVETKIKTDPGREHLAQRTR